MRDEVLQKLKGVVGDDFVSVDPEDIYIYSQDMTENVPSEPDFIVMPESVEEVQAIIQLANECKIPVTPFVAGANIGGLTIPLKGGISLDLRRMKRVIEVNETEMYAVLEPGVTFGHIKAYLEKNHPDLIYAYPFAPPYTSVMCNALLSGLTNLAHRHGCMGDWINGLEVVLPTGEIVKVGSCAVSKYWFGRHPLPDISGLFIGWQGATGVVTKIAVQLYPTPSFKREMAVTTDDVDTTFKFMRRISRTQVLDELTAVSFDVTKMLFGQKPPFKKSPNEPEFMQMLEVSGNTREEVNAKVEVVKGVMKALGVHRGVSISTMMDLPQTLSTLLDFRGGGLTWIGTYGPTANLEEGTKRAYELCDRYGFSRLIYTRSMKGGHFAVLRFLLPFNKSDTEETKRVHELCMELAKMTMDLGYIPYKAPSWVVDLIYERADPNWVDLIKKIKSTLDPNQIMNPNRWGHHNE